MNTANRNLKNEATDANARFDKLRVENESLRKNRAAANSKITDLDRLERGTAEMKTKLDKSQVDNETLRSDLTSANSRVQVLIIASDTLHQDISSIRAKLEYEIILN